MKCVSFPSRAYLKELQMDLYPSREYNAEVSSSLGIGSYLQVGENSFLFRFSMLELFVQWLVLGGHGLWGCFPVTITKMKPALSTKLSMWVRHAPKLCMRHTCTVKLVGSLNQFLQAVNTERDIKNHCAKYFKPYLLSSLPITVIKKQSEMLSF